jgi:hypothetical protein
MHELCIDDGDLLPLDVVGHILAVEYRARIAFGMTIIAVTHGESK